MRKFKYFNKLTVVVPILTHEPFIFTLNGYLITVLQYLVDKILGALMNHIEFNSMQYADTEYKQVSSDHEDLDNLPVMMCGRKLERAHTQDSDWRTLDSAIINQEQ